MVYKVSKTFIDTTKIQNALLWCIFLLLIHKCLNGKLTESLDVVASYDFEKDEWGEEGSLGLARGSSDAAVVRLPRSYWTNKLF